MDSSSTTKAFPGFDRLFILEQSGSRAYRGDMDVATREEALSLTRAELRPTHPIRVNWAMGRARPEELMVWTTYAAPILVAEPVVQMLRSHGFSGWSLYGVSVQDKRGQTCPGHHGLGVTGRCGPIEWARGIEVPRIFPGGVFPVWKGLFFEPASWDGSDFFMSADGSGYVFVVEAVKKAFERAKIRNVGFQPLDQFERPWKL